MHCHHWRHFKAWVLIITRCFHVEVRTRQQLAPLKVFITVSGEKKYISENKIFTPSGSVMHSRRGKSLIWHSCFQLCPVESSLWLLITSCPQRQVKHVPGESGLTSGLKEEKKEEVEEDRGQGKREEC